MLPKTNHGLLWRPDQHAGAKDNSLRASGRLQMAVYNSAARAAYANKFSYCDGQHILSYLIIVSRI